MENDYISDDIKKIDLELSNCSSINEKILYLERRLTNNKQSMVVYGVEGWDENTMEYVQNELEFCYKSKQLSADEEAKGLQKIKWNGSPSLFGFMFRKFIDNGLIEPEKFNGKESIAKTAKLFFSHFDVNNTTLENLTKELNREKQTITNNTEERILKSLFNLK